MAFMGIFVMGLLAFLIMLGVPTLIGIVFLIVALVQWIRQRKQEQKKKSKYIVPGIIGGVFMMPLIFVVVFMGYSMVSGAWTMHNSLAVQVQKGNYERVEALLQKGVSPDCTLESNEKAKDGERTVLSYLCECGGFWDDFEDPVDDVVTDEELAMMKLLIDYGADVNAVQYRHAREYESHCYRDANDPYAFRNTDECGYTPFLYAVDSGEMITVQLLVENGADINTADFCGYTAVHRIADFPDDEQYAEMLPYLIEQGADVYAVNNYGQDAGMLMDWSEDEDTEQIRNVLAEYYPLEDWYSKLIEQ